MSQSFEDLIKKGDELLSRGEFDAAEAVFRQCLQLDSSSAEAPYSIGCVYSHRFEFEKALDWAKEALVLDNEHLPSRNLLGNCLLALKRYTEAKRELKTVYEANPFPETLAQIGLCDEALGKLEDAESAIRKALETDPSYNTRYSAMGIYSFSALSADLHNLLARILQKQGNIKEAKLHYYLSKRNDATISLDPMHQDIMTDVDLETFPGSNELSNGFQNDFEWLNHLAKIEDFKRLKDEIKPEKIKLLTEELKFKYQPEELVKLAINSAQKQGLFYLSAKLRAIGDELHGISNQALFLALCSYSWKKLFEIIERFHENELKDDEIDSKIQKFQFNWESSYLLIHLTNRFIELDYKSASKMVSVIDKLFTLSSKPVHNFSSKVLVSKTLCRSGALKKAILTLESLNDDIELTKSHSLGAFALDIAAQTHLELKNIDKAISIFDRLISLHRSVGLEKDAVQIMLKKTKTLTQEGRREEALAEFKKLLKKLEIADSVGSPGELRSLIKDVSSLTGYKFPENILTTISTKSPDIETAENMLLAAEDLARQNKLDEALDLLSEAEETVYEKASRSTASKVLFFKARLLADQGNLEAAADALAWSLQKIESISETNDLWPVLMESARVAWHLERLSESEKFLERALFEAKRKGELERVNETLKRLSQVSYPSNPIRAISLFGETLNREYVNPNMPTNWIEAEKKFVNKQWLDAIEAFQFFCNQTESSVEQLRPIAIANIAIAKFHLGLTEEAIKFFQDAFSLFKGNGNIKLAADCLIGIIQTIKYSGNEPVEELESLRKFSHEQENLGIRRSLLLSAGDIAYQIKEYDKAETLFLEALEIAISSEWKDVRDEFKARSSLGIIYRQFARYADAIEQYRSALECTSILSDKKSEAEIRGNIAIALRYSDKLDAAVEQYLEAIKICEEFDLILASAFHRMNLSSSLFLLGHKSQGTKELLDSIQIFDRFGYIEHSQRCLVILAQYSNKNDISSDIEERLKKLVFDGLESKSIWVQNWSKSQMAQLAMLKGESTIAKELLEEVAISYRDSGDRYNQARSILGWANLLFLDNPKEAINSALQARKISQDIKQLSLESECNETILRCYINLANEDKVNSQLEVLEKQWNTLRRGLEKDRDRIYFSDQTSLILDECTSFFIKQKKLSRAIEVLDLSRSQSLLDLKNTLEADSSIKIDQVRDLLALSPQKALLIATTWHENSLVILVFSADDPQPEIYPTGITRQSLEETIQIYKREIILFRGEGSENWKNRTKALFSEVYKKIPQNGLVVLLLDEELQALPIHAVPLPNGHTLIHHAAVTYAPSLKSLKLMATQSNKRQAASPQIHCVGVAFPDEALAIMQRFGGQSMATGTTGNHISKESLLFLDQASIIHFACHGYFDPDNHLESGLVLHNTEHVLSRDILSVRDLFNYQLNSDLAVLSACETGRGIASASDFLSLGRSFIAAGSRSVMTALWSVENAATQKLMLNFYSQLFSQTDKALNIAEALRQSQINACKCDSFCNWAAFKLTGWPFFANREVTNK